MPYCPACFLERTQSRVTCPVDGAIYRIQRCAGCASEIAPDERYCINCGRQDGQGRLEVVHLERAPWTSRSLALLMDLLCLFYLAQAFPAMLATLFEVLGPWRDVAVAGVLLASPWIYFSVWNAEGRRTIGGQILGVAILRRDRAPLDLARSCARGAVLYVCLVALGLGVMGALLRVWPPAGAFGLWLPERAWQQLLLIAGGLAMVAPAFWGSRRPLHDLAADSDAFAVT